MGQQPRWSHSPQRADNTLLGAAPSSFLISPPGLDAFLIQAFPSRLRLLKWSNAA